MPPSCAARFRVPVPRSRARASAGLRRRSFAPPTRPAGGRPRSPLVVSLSFSLLLTLGYGRDSLNARAAPAAATVLAISPPTPTHTGTRAAARTHSVPSHGRSRAGAAPPRGSLTVLVALGAQAPSQRPAPSALAAPPHQCPAGARFRVLCLVFIPLSVPPIPRLSARRAVACCPAPLPRRQ